MNPHYNTWLPAIHVDQKNSTALVKSNRTGKSFPVKLTPAIRWLVHRRDRLHIVKSHITGEWIAIDYNAMFGGENGAEPENYVPPEGCDLQ